MFFLGGFLAVLLSWFVVSFEGLAKKVGGSNSLPLSPPLGIANLFVVVSACFRSLVPLETM